ncbi:DUF1259 domain-containing protein [Streptomyces sp. NBC_00057]|uniref:DUF1259 domain-containing protein n=1 Tax=Streptomyces sp. NBC_00057 TaxID=2975634 RepID=UPI0032518653
MNELPQGDTYNRLSSAPARRRMLKAAVLAPVLTGLGAHGAQAGTVRPANAPQHELVQPVPTTEAFWQPVAKVLGRPGSLLRKTVYRTRFPRGDLHVVSHHVTVSPGLALGSHIAFLRYSDGSVMTMGDLTLAERELQHVSDALQAHGIEQTALHKHLLAHSPDIWWTHFHGHGHDPVSLARGLRTAMDLTASPPATPPTQPAPLDLDTAGIDAALGVKGSNDGGTYKSAFMRRETITDNGMVLPPGLGSTTAFNFQPLGGGRAALSGDFAMIADEVQGVLKVLRRGGIDLVELHNHGLREKPRLFYIHLWAVGDAVRLAKALRPAVVITNVAPADSERDPL